MPANNFLLIIYSFLYSFLLGFRFGISIKFRFRFFKYPFYNKILVFLIFSYNKLKLLYSFKWYSIRNPLLGFSGYSKFLLDISGYLISVKFSKILKSVKSGGFFKCKVGISGNFSKFPRFRVGIKVVYYKAFLLITEGSK